MNRQHPDRAQCTHLFDNGKVRGTIAEGAREGGGMQYFRPTAEKWIAKQQRNKALPKCSHWVASGYGKKRLERACYDRKVGNAWVAPHCIVDVKAGWGACGWHHYKAGDPHDKETFRFEGAKQGKAIADKWLRKHK
jgi:hypothetical protein